MTLDFGISCWSGFLLIVQRRSLCSVLRPVYGFPALYDHIYDSIATLYWLRIPKRVYFKVAVMAFCVLLDLALSYLDQLVRVADLSGLRRLRTSTSQLLQAPHTALQLLAGRRSFLVVASIIWNSLPLEVQSSD